MDLQCTDQSDESGENSNLDFSIIKLDSFILATRDSGYKGTNSAIAELVDNSIQAGSTKIAINIIPADAEDYGVTVTVLDNGSGMDPETLRQALRFGGSSRFNDRNSLGRFGMGLPNSSLSQSRRLEVYTWMQSGGTWYSYIDVDEIASAKMQRIPEPSQQDLPSQFAKKIGPRGTLILWSRCDRLDNRRIPTLSRKLLPFLGRVFRCFLWKGVKISVNDQPVKPVDPLYLRSDSVISGATPFGDEVTYKVCVPSQTGRKEAVGDVIVRFSELPVEKWQNLSNERKTELGVSKGAGVSVVRADREIDYGWFFMNGKRKENYDDWWRCEIHFDPVLDEAFGITHTKQQIRPQEYLSEILSPDIGEIARSLNSRVRQAHVELKARKQSQGSIRIATATHKQLRPLPLLDVSDEGRTLIREAEKNNRQPGTETTKRNQGFQYNILHKKVRDCDLYTYSFNKDRFVLNLNPEHPFYRKMYKPLSDSESAKDLDLCEKLELLLLAAARSEALAGSAKEQKSLSKYRKDWSNILAVFLNL